MRMLLMISALSLAAAAPALANESGQATRGQATHQDPNAHAARGDWNATQGAATAGERPTSAAADQTPVPGAAPYPTQDVGLLVSRITRVDPVTGAQVSLTTVSNHPVPNPPR